MPNTPEDIAFELRRRIEELAMELVMGSGLDSPESLRLLAGSVAAIGREAGGADWKEVEGLAGQVGAALAEAGSCGAADLARLSEAVRDGVARLQEAAARPPGQTGQKAVSKQARELAQDRELLKDVILESQEHLTTIEAQMLALEQDPSNEEAVHASFRGFHTIKGLAGFLELGDIQEIAHQTENVLDLARNGKLRITPAVIDVILASKDLLQGALAALDRAANGGSAPPETKSAGLMARIRSLLENPGEEPEEAPGQFVPAAPEAVVANSAEDAGEKAVGKPMEKADEGAAAVARASRVAASVPTVVKVDTAKLDFLADMGGELVIAQSLVRHDPSLAAMDNPRLQRNLAQLARITQEIQKTAMSLRMVPIGQLFRRMTRLVRDLARKAGKQVEMDIAGEDTELDRTIVEALSDPLVHMVRNSIDHGIEPPEERAAAGKNPVGRVLLRAYHQAGQILVEVSDDGRGLNRDRILARARERGLAAQEARLSETDIFNFIFHPGFSTAEKVTGLSGRGVGMDVVRKQIQKLRGRIDIQSSQGKGTKFFLKLPLTLAIIDGLVVGVGRERYIVPLFAVREMFRPDREMLSTVHGRDDMALVRGHLLPVLRLARRLGVAPRSEDPCQGVFIVTENEGRSFCLLVDEFLGKQEVVIKSLGESLKHVPGIAGAAILGDGRVGLVLDIEGIFDQRSDA